MPIRDIVVIGASAGGIEAITGVIRSLPPDLPAAICLVVHIPAGVTSVLPTIVNRLGTLPALHPQQSQTVQPGKIYIAPPDFHLGLKEDGLFLSHGPRENGMRPAVDFLFRTAAESFGPRVIGIVLSGMLYDGTAGLRAIHQHGGLTIAQDPEDALFDSMPASAIRAVQIDHILPAEKIGPLLINLVRGEQQALKPPSPGKDNVKKMAEDEVDRESEGKKLTRLTCPDCGGVLEEIPSDTGAMDYECQVGHRYNYKSLITQQTEQVEHALWEAVRLLQERANLLRRMSRQAENEGRLRSATNLQRSAELTDQNLAVLREFTENQLLSNEPIIDPAEEDKLSGT